MARSTDVGSVDPRWTWDADDVVVDVIEDAAASPLKIVGGTDALRAWLEALDSRDEADAAPRR